MQAPASALGVIAIVSVIMTAMTEAENSAIEQNISHLQNDEKERHLQRHADAQINVNTTQSRRNSTSALFDSPSNSEGIKNISITVSPNENHYPKDDSNSTFSISTDRNVSISRNLLSAAPEADNSPKLNDLSSDLQTEHTPSNNISKHSQGDVEVQQSQSAGESVGSQDNEPKIHEHQVVQTLLNQTEPPEVAFTLGNVSDMEAVRLKSISEQVTSSAENSKAIPFQILSANDKAEIENANRSTSNTDPPESGVEVAPARIEGTKSTSSKQPNSKNNLISRSEKVTDSSRPPKSQGVDPKLTKAFYEIKSLMTTESSGILEWRDASTRRNFHRFAMPTIPWAASAVGKYGPYFEDGEEERNITARIATTVLLDCKIGMLHDKTVTWLQHSKDSIHLLTVGRQVYSADQRVSLSFKYPSNWRLRISYASTRDSGLYECQVATHPPRVKKINLTVTAPMLTIMDDAGRVIAGERHLKAGSALKLSCEARDVREKEGESVIWTRGDETLIEGVSENKTMDVAAGREIQIIISTASVEKATTKDAGNYSCAVPGRARTTVAVHVLSGELPAAVHDGNGVSRAVFNFWLVHLTASCVFSR